VAQASASSTVTPVPERVDAGEMLALIELLEHWTRGATEVPDSVRELRGAVHDALHNRRRGA
jgi:hypothetical protein